MAHDVVHEQRVAVGRRLGDDRGAQRSARAGPVVDDHRLPEHFREMEVYAARDDVGDAAGRPRNHHADGASRVGLGQRVRAEVERDGSGCRNGQRSKFFQGCSLLLCALRVIIER